MAKNRKAQDAAAKAKKQKLILGVMGVAMLGIGAIQGPKLLTQLNPPSAEATPVAVATATGEPVQATPAGAVAIVSSTPNAGPAAILAGVTVQNSMKPQAGPSQLRSFSLFDPKDPFVPQEEEVAPETVTTTTPAAAGTVPGSGGAVGPAGTGSPVAAPTDATITMNGSSYPLQVKKQFPKNDPLFVLVSLKPKVAKIGVAGGAFVNGKTIALRLDRQVTLVNETTGARYTLKLVYTGAGPEQTESFTQAGK